MKLFVCTIGFLVIARVAAAPTQASPQQVEAPPAPEPRIPGFTFDGKAFSSDKYLGSGAYGAVFRAVSQDNSTAVAIKEVVERSSSGLQLANEVDTLTELAGLPRIVDLLDYQKRGNESYLLLEIYEGDLFDLLFSKDLEAYRRAYLTNKIKRHIFLQIIEGIHGMHSRGIWYITFATQTQSHRDLKPENVLFSSNVAKGDINEELVALTDFGLAKKISQSADPGVGSVFQVAPEVAKFLFTNVSRDLNTDCAAQVRDINTY